MPVQMHGMGVVGAIAHDETVSGALLQLELALMRIGLAIDQPGVEFSEPTGNLLEDHLNCLLGRWRTGGGSPKDRVVPRSLGRVNPLRLTVLAGVLHDDTQTGFAHRLLCRTQNPN